MRKQTKLVAALSVTALFAVGASMTSFAKGWTDLGDEEWVYLDSDGERVTQEWKRSGSEYYWLDEDGNLAKSQLVDDGDDIYYVTSTGARLKNDWAMVENEDEIEVNGEEVDVLYYYFGSNGKAYRSEDSNFKKKTIAWGGSNKTFFFDADGHMASGWVEHEGDVYYCGSELQGYAFTDWQYLEPNQDLAGQDYDDLEWFNFKSSGKMRKADAGKVTTTWYSNGWYYTFDENGVMQDDWYDITVSTSAVADGNIGPATNPRTDSAFTTSVGTKGTGWVYTEDKDESDYHWYYLVAVRDGKDVVRNVPFNSQSGDELMRAKVIKGKTYLFKADGTMVDGVKEITDDNTLTPANQEVKNGKKVDDYKGGAIAKPLDPGYYYFNNGARSVKGQMLTGKQAYTDDGETFYYYFDKSTGKALTDTVKDGVVYGHDGKRIQADDGNANEIVVLEHDLAYSKGTAVIGKDSNGKDIKGIKSGSEIIVSSTGKLRTAGTVRVDGMKYKVVTGDSWSLVPQDD